VGTESEAGCRDEGIAHLWVTGDCLVGVNPKVFTKVCDEEVVLFSFLQVNDYLWARGATYQRSA
jgi:hypothetical protein